MVNGFNRLSRFHVGFHFPFSTDCSMQLRQGADESDARCNKGRGQKTTASTNATMQLRQECKRAL